MSSLHVVKTSSSVRRATTERIVLFVALAAVGCAGAVQAAGSMSARSMDSRSGEPVPFAFDSLDERIVSADTMRGKPTLIAFVTTDSLAAQAQVDFLVAMAKKDAIAVNYVVVALGPEDTRELVELYRRALHVTFPVAMADGATLAGGGSFGDVRAVPVTILLDRDGRVVWRADGRVAKSAEMRAAMAGL